MIDWIEEGKAAVLVGGAFGSEGKGQIAAWLSRKSPHVDIATTNAGAQAGHTSRWRDGRSYVCFHLPTHGVERADTAYINAGSIIDGDVLAKELTDCGLDPARVVIHPNATIITKDDVAAEKAKGSGPQRHGSTMKGVGSAISNKVMRRATLVGQDEDMCRAYNVWRIDLNARLKDGARVVVEVPQGFGLSINHGHYYPYTTSRDCWVGSGLSDAGIHPSFLGELCMVVRTAPIRVGNPHNELGEKLGDSGPFYPGSVELDWARDLPGVEPEKTTVTKRVRRIATWSDQQYYDACSFNRPTIVALTFCDYLPNEMAFLALVGRMVTMEERVGLRPRAIQRVYSFGNCVDDVTEDPGVIVQFLRNR